MRPPQNAGEDTAGDRSNEIMQHVASMRPPQNAGEDSDAPDDETARVELQ